MDFTQMPVSQGYKYLLIMIDTFTGWMEGFPTRNLTAEEVVKKKKKLLHEIIPRFGLPRSSQSDNGTSLTSKVTQAKQASKVTQSCPTLCHLMGPGLPGSSVHGIFQVRMLQWVAISFSGGCSQTRDRT